MLAWAGMKILGLLGVLLWLGTLLANAGGAEKARLDLELADEWSVPVFAAPSLCAESTEDAAKDLSGLAPGFVIPPSVVTISPRQSVVETPLMSANRQALRRLLVTWHLGQGPPVA